jgi:hypothetical protein
MILLAIGAVLAFAWWTERKTVATVPVTTVTSPVTTVASNSSPLAPDQKVTGYIPSDIGPVPIVISSLTTGNVMNIAQVWINGTSHFAATYRDGSMMEVNATGKVVGPWPPA